uniref:Ventrally expressed dharma/bozozok antagonist n=1 Tax=Hucho hucho TaxID=62062 RepID=A0A4W5PRZ3_9TELE
GDISPLSGWPRVVGLRTVLAPRLPPLPGHLLRLDPPAPLGPTLRALSETGFISGTEGETSGYESEGGHSLSPTTPLDGSSSPPMGRRPRTAYTAEQINSLERAFKRNAYLGTRDKVELCKKLNLSDKQIRNWFQNRRMRMKRMVQDALAQACQAKVASHLLHYPELHAYHPGPYHPHHAGAEGGAATPFLHPHYSSSTANLTFVVTFFRFI